jgi:hypothetical protein
MKLSKTGLKSRNIVIDTKVLERPKVFSLKKIFLFGLLAALSFFGIKAWNKEGNRQINTSFTDINNLTKKAESKYKYAFGSMYGSNANDNDADNARAGATYNFALNNGEITDIPTSTLNLDLELANNGSSYGFQVAPKYRNDAKSGAGLMLQHLNSVAVDNAAKLLQQGLDQQTNNVVIESQTENATTGTTANTAGATGGTTKNTTTNTITENTSNPGATNVNTTTGGAANTTNPEVSNPVLESKKKPLDTTTTDAANDAAKTTTKQPTTSSSAPATTPGAQTQNTEPQQKMDLDTPAGDATDLRKSNGGEPTDLDAPVTQ